MMSSPAPTRVVAHADTPIVSLDVVDIRPELERRPHRASRMAEEHRAFTTLAADMASNPRNMLQKLVEVAVELVRRAYGGHQFARGRRVSVGSGGRRLRRSPRRHDAARSEPVRRLHRSGRDAVDASRRPMLSSIAGGTAIC